MIMRFTLSASLALALSAAACARDAETVSQDASEPVTETAVPAAAEQAASPAAFEFPDTAWREIDPENTLYIETDHGMVVVEMAPEFAPNHVERMKTLTRERFYDFLIWHRVIADFMAQGGGSRANPGLAAEMPPLEAEFTVRRASEPAVSELQDRVVNPGSLPQRAKAGFWNGFHAGTQSAAAAAITQDGMVQSWLLHCRGAAAMARTSDPNSARSQFYITTASPDHLNATYTVWGRVRHGMEAIDALAVGSAMENPDFSADVIRSVRVGSELPESDRLEIEVVDTDSAAFAEYLNTLRDAQGALPDICDISVPTRIQE